MIGILIVTHGSLADSLVECAIHVLGSRPPALATLDFTGHADPDERQTVLRARLEELAKFNTTPNEGVLVLADVFGATPCNTLCRQIEPGRIEGISGANLPMLLKVLTTRESLPLSELVAHIVEGGRDSIHHISESMCHAATGR